MTQKQEFLSNLTPRQICEERLQLSADYSKYSGFYAEHIKKQADYFVKHRQNYKSDTATQRAFESTDAGVTMEILKQKLKAIDKRMSALNTMLRLYENEAKNAW